MDMHFGNAAVTRLGYLTPELLVVSLAVFAGLALWIAVASKSGHFSKLALSPYLQFAYNNFIKPHNAKAGDGQQSALESFYARQVGACGLSSDQQLRHTAGRYL
jgi:hypothetical protein